MRLTLGELRMYIETQLREDAYHKHHMHLHETAECIKLKPGKKYAAVEPVRIIPDLRRPGFYFGGDAWGSRARGQTEMTLRPGVEVLCYAVEGSEGWFAVPTDHGEFLKVRINVNKFCQATRDKEAQRKALKKSVGKPNKGEIPDDLLSALMGKTAKPAAQPNKPLSREERIAQLRAELEALENESMPEPEVMDVSDDDFELDDDEEPSEEDIDKLFGI